MAVTGHLEQPTRGLSCRCGSHLAAYLALLRLGVTVPPLLPAARWALTPPFHPYPAVARWAVCSLWPCPSPRGAQALPGSLPGGARTFLGRLAAPATITLGQRGEYKGMPVGVGGGAEERSTRPRPDVPGPAAPAGRKAGARDRPRATG